MPYTIQIDNNTVETTLGFTATFRLDEQLDTASFVVPTTTKKDPFATNLTVAVNDGFTTSYWLIASDYVEPVSVNPSLYSHTIDLIEYTKKLEYYFISALAFTQPTDGSIRYNLFNVIDRLRKTIDVELDSTTTNFPYDIPTSTELALINFKSPEMFFNNMTLLEALKQTLMYVGALPRLTQQGGQDILLLDFIAEKKDLFPWDNLWVGYSAAQDASFYATEIISEIDNAIASDLKNNTIYYPDEFGWAALSSPTGAGIVNNNSAVMDLKQNIYEIKKLFAYAILEGDNLSSAYEAEFDLSNYVVRKERYNLLPVTWDGTETQSQINTIWYEEGSPYIDGLTTDWFTLFTGARRSLENALASEVRKLFPLASNVRIKDDYYRFLFRVEFIPIQQERQIAIERSNVDVVNKISKVFFRQNDRVVSLDSYTSRMKKTIDRVGEPTFNVTIIHSDPSELYHVGDYTDDDYRVTIAEYQYEKDYIGGSYQLVKHFPNINKFIGVDRGLQPFELPTGFKVLNRPITYKDYLIIGTEPSSVNSSRVLGNGVNQILNTFNNSYAPVEAQTSLVTNPALGNQRLYAPMVINGLENTLIFNFGFPDNQLAGYRLVPVDSAGNVLQPGDVAMGIVQLGVPYAPNGVMEEAGFQIKAKRTFDIPQTFAQAQAEANFLPLVNWDISEPTYIRVLNNDPIVVLKDPAEILNFNYQLNIFGESSQIIIGKYFTRLNKLIYDLDEPLYFFPTINEYTQYDNERVITSGAPTLLSTTITSTLPFSITVNNFIPSGTNSYAIATQSGELLLAVNRVDGVLPTTLNFNFSHVRPGTSRL